MSLINDMLRDLEARKRAEGQQANGAKGTASAAGNGVPHALDARTRGSHDSTDEHIRYRMRWLLPAYALALVALAVGLYLSFTGPNGLLRSDSFSRAVSAGTAGADARVAGNASNAAAPDPQANTVPPQPPRLVMIGIDEAKGPALTLNLRFAPALAAPLRVDVVDGTVSLFAAGAQAEAIESPSPLLAAWHSEPRDEGWHVRFNWAGRAEVSLQPVLGSDTSQGWVIRLLPRMAAVADDNLAASAAKPVAAVPARRSAQPEAPDPTTRAPSPVAVKAAPLGSVQRDASTLYADAWRLQRAGQVSEAIAQLERLLQTDPTHAQGRELLARLLARVGRPDQAIQILRDGLVAVPGQPAWVELLARLHDGRGQREQAIAVLSTEGSADNANHQALFGALAAQAGRYSDAALAYRRLLALDAGQSRWWLGLAVALDNSGDAVAARVAYQGALDAGSLDQKAEQFVRQRLAALSSGESQ
ncbi:MAG: tetratricopeptide repeat protein [Xanthomonadaceae bacterium]|nr:tetratricopeptide repeat protein [Xanthomonadaceae bacterium]MDP2184702.1 tetratricopeptide repeat protein [Xanthomonadales bacterium]MDZ4116959.1 tetratricopeptide repeat protein [Xanthomonadaceae bacterium]MDZ4376678.1 tetratricopeptide repeat protein [Xanthomonadaceae bacterium]